MARPFACRIGLHRWQRLRSPDGTWYRQCRKCGSAGDGVATFALLLSSLVLVAGLAIVMVLQWLLGAILVVGGIGGLGWALLPTGLERLGGFLRYRE
jgi:hypothetical protein